MKISGPAVPDRTNINAFYAAFNKIDTRHPASYAAYPRTPASMLTFDQTMSSPADTLQLALHSVRHEVRDRAAFFDELQSARRG
jgi:hypothetical protein